MSCVDKYDIICITETKFNDDILDAEVKINNFIIFRVDRVGHCGGGACIYVRNSLLAEHVTVFNVGDCLAVKVIVHNTPLIIMCMYRSPSLSYDQSTEMITSLSGFLSSLQQDVHVLVFGDFNLPDVDWDVGTVIAPCNTSNKTLIVQQLFLDSFRDRNLTWLLGNQVTRSRLVSGCLQTSTLDQVLTTDSNMVNNVILTPPLGKSDHLGVLCALNLATNYEMLQLDRPNWCKINPAEILKHGSELNWKCPGNSIENSWSVIVSNIETITAEVPTYNSRITKSGNVIVQEPYSTAGLRKSYLHANRRWKTFTTDPTSTNFNIASETSKVHQEKLQKAMIHYEGKITAKLKANPKLFYSYMASKRKVRNCISALKDKQGNTLTAAEDIANELGSFFESTFTLEPDGDVPQELLAYQPREGISDLKINANTVQNILGSLKVSKSPGPDNVHPKLLRSLSANIEFVTSITNLFQTAYDTGKMPEVWKLANITALHKKGDKFVSRNYRPISLTCVLSKCYEKIIRDHVMSHIQANICKEQHGFIANKSCFSNLLECMHRAYDILDSNETLDIVYLDFMKAFDSVPHKRLLEKLKLLGITGRTLETIKDFLVGRRFRVRVGQKYSKFFFVLSGVPQGTVLGPLLFIIYINDLPMRLKCFVLLFADDLKLLAKGSNHKEMQEDLDYLTEWQNTWLLKFNTVDRKCKVMHVGTTNPNCTYYLNQTELPTIEEEKDLGVLVTNDLSWNTNIDKSIVKANSTIGWTMRNIISRERNVMLSIFKTLVRPHLEYCVQLWAPCPDHGNWKTIMKIEGVQRRFTRMISGIGHLPYQERLEELQITTLIERRARGDLIECFKIFKGIANYGSNLLTFSRSGYNLINNTRPAGRLSRAFPARVTNYWNKIPDTVKDCATVDAFKGRLQTFKKERSQISGTGNYWELSEEIFKRINDVDRDQLIQFLGSHSRAAKKIGFNIGKQNH